MLARTSTEQ
uniref:Uncharacterized protein n=1 Tax=Rhizophora mucronata TaxID=61149 RepID=A0A2P2JSC6_RHIMU